MKLSGILVVLAALLSSAGTSAALDGERTGFVFGGGLGFAPIADTEHSGITYSLYQPYNMEFDGSRSGIGGHLFAGYGIANNTVIVGEFNLAAYQVDRFMIQDQEIAHGFLGLAWYFYFGTSAKTFFTVFGLGAYGYVGEGFSPHTSGPALLLGLGYEFTRHLQIAAYAATGKSSSHTHHAHLNLLLSAYAY